MPRPFYPLPDCLEKSLVNGTIAAHLDCVRGSLQVALGFGLSLAGLLVGV